MVAIVEIRRLATKFQSISWKRIFREANFVVDAFAKHGLNLHSNHIWDGVVPNFVGPVINFNLVGDSCSCGFSL